VGQQEDAQTAMAEQILCEKGNIAKLKAGPIRESENLKPSGSADCFADL
jgi:hypothetical protein